MISYTLKCENEHRFDSWFQSSAAFAKLRAEGMIACPVCNTGKVEKSIMAPRVRPARSTSVAPSQTAPDTPQENTQSLSAPTNDAEKELAKLKTEIETNAEYVGMEFATRARDMYVGDTPQKPIYGETSVEDAKKLVEDGVPVAPLPFVPTRKTN